MMSNGFYLIEISKTDNTFYIAAVKKRNSNDNYLIQLEWDSAKEILAQFQINETENKEEDFDKIVDNLEILDNRLVLLNPKVRQQRVIRKKRGKTRGANSQPRPRMKKKKIEKIPDKEIVENEQANEALKQDENQNLESESKIEENTKEDEPIENKSDDPIKSEEVAENTEEVKQVESKVIFIFFLT